jgi:hypothetical protein
MANSSIKFKTESSITIEIPERQFLTLAGLASYNNITTVEMLLKNLGKTYIGPYANDLVAFLNSIRDDGIAIKRRIARVKEAAHGEDTSSSV